MKKKLLFLYPIEEYMEILNANNTIEILKKTIDERYRKKGYEVNFLVFPDKTISSLDVHDNDKTITTDITFNEHTKPIKSTRAESDTYRYPSNKDIQSKLGPVDELVISGFHAQDCVKKVTEFFQSKILTF